MSLTRNEMLDKIKKINDKAKVEDRFSLFMFDCVKRSFKNNNLSDDQLELTYNLVKEWDEVSKLPYNTGMFLNELEKDDTIDVGIHRTNFDYINDGSKILRSNNLEDIMCNGLQNSGHLNAVGGSAVLDNIAPPSTTISRFKGLEGLINLTGSYKNNNTTVIFAFPKGLVDEDFDYMDESKIPSIYDLSEITPRVKNKYIVGALIKDKNGIDSLYLRDEILENRYNMENNISNK